MPFVQNKGLRYFQFETIAVRHAIFTRRGGVSPEPWSSLNVGGTVGDDIRRVRRNRLMSFEALGCKSESIFDVWQVHSADVVCSDVPRPHDEPYRKADIILTDRPEVTLFMRFADCIHILFLDRRKGVVGLAHAGWLGTVRAAASAAIAMMREKYGTNPADIQAGIGPSIGPDHYEVGADVIAQVKQKFGDDAADLFASHDGKTHFNLWEANRIQLEREGVGRIEISGICTACHIEDWYSHRAERGRTGRFGALIALQ